MEHLMKTKISLFLYAAFALAASPAAAQYYDLEHKLEGSAIVGYSWTTSRSFNFEGEPGKIDITSSEYYGVEVDVNVNPDGQLALLFTRQESSMTFKDRMGVTRRSVPMTVEYLQIGGVGLKGFGPARGYGKFMVGATHYSFNDPGFADDWRFSIIMAIGAKFYVSELIGLRIEGAMPYTIINGGSGIWLGTGGAGFTLGGSGIPQWQVSAGATILLGG